MIFHVTEADRWQESQRAGAHTGSTRGVDLSTEGFIHCSTAAQWRSVVERYYVGANDLLLLHIDETLLTSPVIREAPPGASEEFPHVYGPINLDAVVHVEPITL